MPADTLSLAGKTAIVTGSGRETGIGAGIARALARNGANVVIHHVTDGSRPRAEKLAQTITEETGSKTTVIQCGVESYENAKDMVEQTMKAFGVDKVDILSKFRFLCQPITGEGANDMFQSTMQVLQRTGPSWKSGRSSSSTNSRSTCSVSFI